MSKISIIVPVHNVELYLEKCIDSLINQTFSDIEIILVVNNSKDKSFEIARNYASQDKRIKLIVTPKGGVSHARNLGLANAKGQYITFVDSDDYVDTDLFSLLYQTMIKEESDIISFYTIKENNKEFMIGREEFISNKIINTADKERMFGLFVENIMERYVCTKLFNKKVIKNVKFPEDYRMCEDEIFLINVLKNCNKLTIIPFKKYHYVQHESSVCNSRFDAEVRWDIIKSKKYITQIMDKYQKKLSEESKLNLINALINYSILASLSNSKLNKERKDEIKFEIRQNFKFIFKIRYRKIWKIYALLLTIHYDLFNYIFKIYKNMQKKISNYY